MTDQLETGLVISLVSREIRITSLTGVGTNMATTQLITTWCLFQMVSRQLVVTRVAAAIHTDARSRYGLIARENLVNNGTQAASFTRGAPARFSTDKPVGIARKIRPSASASSSFEIRPLS